MRAFLSPVMGICCQRVYTFSYTSASRRRRKKNRSLCDIRVCRSIVPWNHEIHFLAFTLTLSPLAHGHYCHTPTKGQHLKPLNKTIFTFQTEVVVLYKSRKNTDRTLVMYEKLLFVSSRLPAACFFCPAPGLTFFYLLSPHSTHHFLPLSTSLSEAKIPVAPLREVCENAQCSSPPPPGCPPPAQSVRRGPCI